MSRRRPISDSRRSPSSRPTRERRQPRRISSSANSSPPRSTSKRSSSTDARQPRRVRRLILAGLVVSILALGTQWLLQQPFLRVQHVSFVGVTHEDVAAVRRASGLWAHPTMFGLSASSLEKNLSNFPWIVGVAVEKRWPNSVTVRISEATAVGCAFDSTHHLRYVDQRGVNLGPAPLNCDLPTLAYTGPTTSWPFNARAHGSAVVASQLPPAFSQQVSTISVNALGAVRISLTTPVTFVLGPPIDLKAKFVAIASTIAHVTLRAGDVVDVTVPTELAVTGPGASQSTRTGSTPTTTTTVRSGASPTKG
jgi:cell division protein FtsQ